MLLFKDEELINYLTALQVNKSVYEYVSYESEVEREFAQRLDEREDIKLFVKLPGWFEIETPVGKYNPDWAIIKQNGQALYLVRETKGTRDFLKLRTSEADKVRCGLKALRGIGRAVRRRRVGGRGLGWQPLVVVIRRVLWSSPRRTRIARGRRQLSPESGSVVSQEDTDCQRRRQLVAPSRTPWHRLQSHRR